MKIKINEMESYEFALPEVITPKEFFAFQDRLEKIGKLIRSNTDFETKTIIPQKRIRLGSHLTREQKVEIMKSFYTGTPENKAEVQNKYGVKFKGFSSPNYWRTNDKIEAKEIGMIRYPQRGESRGYAIDKLKIGFKDKDNSNSKIKLKDGKN